MKLSIVIPCYNEEKNIPLLLEKFNTAIKSEDIEVILVNNGSTDHSANVLDHMLTKYNFLKIVDVTINQGYGYGIISGLKKAKGQFIGYTHADLQTDPEDVLQAFKVIAQQEKPENCYIKGNRRGRNFFDQFFTWGMSFFESFYLRSILWDINAQPNIFDASFIDGLEDIPNDFSFDLFLLYMAKKKNLNVIRFDVYFAQRVYGVSSWNTGLHSKWKFIMRTINFSTKLKKRIH